MEVCVRVWVLLELLSGISTFTEEKILSKAIESYNQGSEGELTFHLLEITLRLEEDMEVIHTSFQTLPRPISSRFIRRLLRLFHKNLLLTTATADTRNMENGELPQQLEFLIKETVCQKSNSPSNKFCTLKENSVPKYCTAYQSEQDPMKYIVTCKNITQEYKQPVLEGLEDIKKNGLSRDKGQEEEEEQEEEKEQSGNWEGDDEIRVQLPHSRCLQCISDMLKPNKG